MSHRFVLCSAALCAVTLVSCETTGDPTQGGLFGWSQQKADYRRSALENELHSLNNENRRLQSNRSALQSQKARLNTQQ
jgi:hypothetical protein